MWDPDQGETASDLDTKVEPSILMADVLEEMTERTPDKELTENPTGKCGRDTGRVGGDRVRCAPDSQAGGHTGPGMTAAARPRCLSFLTVSFVLYKVF